MIFVKDHFVLGDFKMMVSSILFHLFFEWRLNQWDKEQYMYTHAFMFVFMPYLSNMFIYIYITIFIYTIRPLEGNRWGKKTD